MSSHKSFIIEIPFHNSKSPARPTNIQKRLMSQEQINISLNDIHLKLEKA